MPLECATDAAAARVRAANDAFRRGLAPAPDGALPEDVSVWVEPQDSPDFGPPPIAEGLRLVAATNDHARDPVLHARGSVRLGGWWFRWSIRRLDAQGCTVAETHDERPVARRELFLSLGFSMAVPA